jgi:hypothetical protein
MKVERDGSFPKFDWEAASALWAEEAAPLGRQILRAHAPFKTGAFRESIDERQATGPGSRSVVFYSQSPITRYILDGTAPHVIQARNARALRWLGPGGLGAPRFAKRVNHPGTKPNPFPGRAMPLIGVAVSRMFAEAVKRSLGVA